ncbi:hypothetical protein G6011_04988 [Alternaria panax]|uniref:RanBP2-type domain-containing protein n=1 Tax=Alternaria panax TaxID=48097 RepID=A0AAD4FBT5_9PLEO|nr:hypothetical protein G6011_04988 [Alternaria panax]
MLKRPIKTERGYRTIITPFSGAELANLGFQRLQGDVASGTPLESDTELAFPRKQNTSNGKNLVPPTRRARANVGPENDLQRHVPRKTDIRQPYQPHPQDQRAHTLTGAEPSSRSISCPICHFDNPATSAFCSVCHTPHPPSPAPQLQAQGIVKHDLLPDTYPKYRHWKEDTLITLRSYHEDFLSTDAAGPPGAMDDDGSRVIISASELQRLNNNKEDARIDDSMRKVRDQQRQRIARENGIEIPVHSEPYYSQLGDERTVERLTTRQALSLERSPKAERL